MKKVKSFLIGLCCLTFCLSGCQKADSNKAQESTESENAPQEETIVQTQTKKEAEQEDIEAMAEFLDGCVDIARIDSLDSLDKEGIYNSILGPDLVRAAQAYSYFYGEPAQLSDGSLLYEKEKANTILSEIFDLDESILLEDYSSSENGYVRSYNPGAAPFANTNYLNYSKNGDAYTFYLLTEQPGPIMSALDEAQAIEVKAVHAVYNPQNSLLSWTITKIDSDLSPAPEGIQAIPALLEKIMELSNTYPKDGYPTFYIADLDQDGILELIGKGKDGLGATYEIFVWNGSGYVLLDELIHSSSAMEIDADGSILIHYGHMGSETVWRLDVEENSISETQIYENYTEEGDYKEYGYLPEYYLSKDDANEFECYTSLFRDLVLWVKGQVSDSTYILNDARYIDYSADAFSQKSSSSTSTKTSVASFDKSSPESITKPDNQEDILNFARITKHKYNYSGPCIIEIIAKTKGIDLSQEEVAKEMGLDSDQQTCTYTMMENAINEMLSMNKISASYTSEIYDQEEVDSALEQSFLSAVKQNVKDGYPTIVLLYDFINKSDGGVYGMIYGTGTQDGETYYSIYVPKLNEAGYDGCWSEEELLNMMKEANWFMYLA